MGTKEITLPSGSYLLVEVPEDAFEFKLINSMHNIYYRQESEYFHSKSMGEKFYPERWSIIGKADELKEDDWKGIVDKLRDSKGFDGYKNYSEWFTIFEENFDTSTESGLSLIASHNLNPSTILILKLN